MSYVKDRLAEIAYERQAAALEDPVVFVEDMTPEEPSTRMVKVNDRDRPGHVYFVKIGRNVKIGFSSQINTRLGTLQTANPERMELLLVIPGTPQTERFFHELFSEFRIRGEWFIYSRAINNFIYMKGMSSYREKKPFDDEKETSAPRIQRDVVL